MSDLLPRIGLALEAFKSRQQDIDGLGQRAFKDLFAAANASLLTAIVQNLIQKSHAEMITPNAPKTSLLAAVSQHHTEIIAGCRVLTNDDGILRALTDAANAATTEAFHLIFEESPKKPASPRTRTSTKRSTPANEEREESSVKTAAKATKGSVKKTTRKKGGEQ